MAACSTVLRRNTVHSRSSFIRRAWAQRSSSGRIGEPGTTKNKKGRTFPVHGGIADALARAVDRTRKAQEGRSDLPERVLADDR